MKRDMPSSIEPSGVTRRDALASAVGLVIAGVSGGVGADRDARDHGAVGINGAANGIELIAEISTRRRNNPRTVVPFRRTAGKATFTRHQAAAL